MATKNKFTVRPLESNGSGESVWHFEEKFGADLPTCFHPWGVSQINLKTILEFELKNFSQPLHRPIENVKIRKHFVANSESKSKRVVDSKLQP